MDTYKEKYNEALERAKEQLETAKVFDYKEEQIAHDIRETVYAIFPLLKESEDEKTRKDIVGYLKRNLRLEWAAWLEKQGEQKSQRMISAEAKEAMYDKPAWSEKDEQHIDSLLKRLDGLCRNEFKRTRFAINEDENWLKSLKQRIGG